jgi:hypothetical protein
MQSSIRRGARLTTWAITAFAILLGVGSFYALDQVKKRTKEIVLDTMPGLSNAGLASATLTQSFVYTLLIVNTPAGTHRDEYVGELITNTQRTTDALKAYRASLFTDEDRQNYQELEQRRAIYLEKRQRCIDLSLTDAAVAQQTLMSEVWPLYEGYRDQGEKLLKYNIAQGVSRGEQILRIASLAQFVAVVASILIFAGGFTAAMVRVVTSIEW